MGSFASLLEGSLRRREGLLDRLRAEGTDCYRLFHGIAEGLPGLTVDRYGPLVLAQTFREELSGALEDDLRKAFPERFSFVYNHRGKTAPPVSADEFQCREFGLKYLIRPRHRGMDPWLFLDLRAGRRCVREAAKGRSVLNLFAYTCGVGVCAAAAGASEVWNVDFASSNLEVGRRNAELNGVPSERFRIIRGDCLPAMRQLAGLPPGSRRSQKRRFPKFEPRSFDIVFLDPPAWAKGPFGAVDVQGDYPGLFKPALLAAKPGGGLVIATNHAANVPLDSWMETLRRCAAKAGRPIRSMRAVKPDEDFPSFDGNPPLKVAICEV
ncbi:MAG: class I SAM-dependent methyltransferase [Elusimicrobiota bacterium]